MICTASTCDNARSDTVSVRLTSPASEGLPAMAATITIEGHPLASRAGLWCPQGHYGRVEVDVAIVHSGTLEVLRRVTASECVQCGASSD